MARMWEKSHPGMLRLPSSKLAFSSMKKSFTNGSTAFEWTASSRVFPCILRICSSSWHIQCPTRENWFPFLGSQLYSGFVPLVNEMTITSLAPDALVQQRLDATFKARNNGYRNPLGSDAKAAFQKSDLAHFISVRAWHIQLYRIPRWFLSRLLQTIVIVDHVTRDSSKLPHLHFYPCPEVV